MNNELNIITELQDSQTRVLRDLRHFVDTYDVVDDVVRLSFISKIWTMIRNNQYYKFNLLYPRVADRPFVIDQIDEATRIYEDVDAQIEGMEMIHVDEPGHAFKVRSRELLNLVEMLYSVDDKILDNIGQLVSPEELAQITTDVENEKATHQTTNY